jgi:hypothetical protein
MELHNIQDYYFSSRNFLKLSLKRFHTGQLPDDATRSLEQPSRMC